MAVLSQVLLLALTGYALAGAVVKSHLYGSKHSESEGVINGLHGRWPPYPHDISGYRRTVLRYRGTFKGEEDKLLSKAPKKEYERKEIEVHGIGHWKPLPPKPQPPALHYHQWNHAYGPQNNYHQDDEHDRYPRSIPQKEYGYHHGNEHKPKSGYHPHHGYDITGYREAYLRYRGKFHGGMNERESLASVKLTKSKELDLEGIGGRPRHEHPKPGREMPYPEPKYEHPGAVKHHGEMEPYKDDH